MAGFLTVFTPFNVYWGFGGRWGVSWIVGCEDCLPLAAVWVQQLAIIFGTAIVLGRAGVWAAPLPHWVLHAGAWGMAATFGAISIWNLGGDNTLQARLLFAPVAALMCGLCVLVAQDPVGRSKRGIRDDRDEYTKCATIARSARRSRTAAVTAAVVLLLTSAVHGIAFPGAVAEVADPPVDRFMNDLLPGMWLFFSWHLAVVASLVLWAAWRRVGGRSQIAFALAVATGDAVLVGVLAGWLFFGTLLIAVSAALLVMAALLSPSPIPPDPPAADLRRNDKIAVPK